MNRSSSVASTMAKLAALAEILKAATVLKRYGLTDEEPAAVVKRFVEANPDIDATLARLSVKRGRINQAREGLEGEKP